jgi:Fe-S-cluster containining protein
VRAALAEAARAFQRERVIPHCPSCSRPCCALDELVLELDFPRVQALYQIGTSKRAFDDALAAPDGEERHPHVRRGTGSTDRDRYYAHGAPCLAFDSKTHHCAVYNTPHKPPGCTDFPVYADADGVTVDRRCEVVASELEAIATRLVESLPPGMELVQEEDASFPQLFVHFSARAHRPRGRRPR